MRAVRVHPSLVTVLITERELAEDDPRLTAFDFRNQKPFDDLEETEGMMAQAVAMHHERDDS